jgi:hypothetical protein
LGLFYQAQKFADRLGFYLEKKDVAQNYRIISDFGQNAYWQPEDGFYIDEEIWDVKMGKLRPDTWFEKLQKCYDDHRNVKFNRSGKLFQPVHVSKRKKDMVTNDGIFRLNQLATGESTNYFKTYGAGTGNAREMPNDDRLVSEIYRVSLITDGYAQAAGDSQVYVGRFPPQAPSATIYETAVFDQLEGGIPLFRTVFDEESKIVHKEFEGTYTLSQTIKLIGLPTIR